jgi:hypothetical protein
MDVHIKFCRSNILRRPEAIGTLTRRHRSLAPCDNMRGHHKYMVLHALFLKTPGICEKTRVDIAGLASPGAKNWITQI